MTKANASAATEPPSEAPTHAHRWSAMRFELVDDRPFVAETCATCGAVRRYRAWERYWEPGEGEIRR